MRQSEASCDYSDSISSRCRAHVHPCRMSLRTALNYSYHIPHGFDPEIMMVGTRHFDARRRFAVGTAIVLASRDHDAVDTVGKSLHIWERRIKPGIAVLGRSMLGLYAKSSGMCSGCAIADRDGFSRRHNKPLMTDRTRTASAYGSVRDHL